MDYLELEYLLGRSGFEEIPMGDLINLYSLDTDEAQHLGSRWPSNMICHESDDGEN